MSTNILSQEEQSPTSLVGFSGFDFPKQNYFKMPSEWTNITARVSKAAELKVVEYVLKHTWGFQEYGLVKQISVNEFMRGRRRKDGTRMDRGTGLSKQSVIDGLKSAVERGLLIEQVDSSDKGRVKKYYALRMREGAENEGGEEGGVKNLDPPVKKLDHRGQESRPRTEKETIERNSVTVNGAKSVFKNLPDLTQLKEKTEYVAERIAEELGDKKSLRFYRLVAAKVPEDAIYQAISESKQEGDNPARLFTHKMKLHAVSKRKVNIAGG